MPTISSLDELLVNLTPYLKFTLPLQAMKKPALPLKVTSEMPSKV
jgi:hypothetical protein